MAGLRFSGKNAVYRRIDKRIDVAKQIKSASLLLLALLTFRFTGLGQTAAAPAPLPSSDLKDIIIPYGACNRVDYMDDKSDPDRIIRNSVLKPTIRNIYQTWLDHIPENARPPKNQKSYTKVHLTVLPDGKTSESVIDSSSGDKEEDAAVLYAIWNFTPVSFPLTAKMHSLVLNIRFLVNMKCEESETVEPQKSS